MKKLFFSLITCILIFTSFVQSKDLRKKYSNQPKQIFNFNIQKYFYKRFEGKIGDKYSIVINFIRQDSLIDGNYYYEMHGFPIHFNYDSRIDSSGNFKINAETDGYDTNYLPIFSGEFQGKFFAKNKIEGYYKRPGKNVGLKFALKEIYPEGSTKIKMKNFSKSYQNGWQKADIVFLFPVLYNLSNKAIERNINTDIKNIFLKDYNFGERNKIWKTFNEMTNDFINRYKEFVNDTSLANDYKPMWENSFTTDIIFNSNYILSLENTEFRFEGGAHPITFFYYKNYNLNTGKEIELNELFNNDYKSELDRIGEKMFRKAYNIKPNESFEKAGYFIGKEGFHLNNNFSIAKGGLLFRFEEYEIGPYVFGAPTVFIPYSKIKDLINPTGLLAQFIK